MHILYITCAREMMFLHVPPFHSDVFSSKTLFFSNAPFPAAMRSNGLLVSAVLCVGTFTLTHLAFVGPATGANAPKVARAARGGGEYDISDADIQNFYNSLRLWMSQLW